MNIRSLRNLPLLAASLLLMAVIVLFALSGLALDGNWPKFARVSLAALGYIGCLMPFRHRLPPYSIVNFVLAGGVAGFISGLVRPAGSDPLMPLIQPLLGGLVLAPMHWASLRWYSSLRSRILA
jgi:hypothetical protein